MGWISDLLETFNFRLTRKEKKLVIKNLEEASRIIQKASGLDVEKYDPRVRALLVKVASSDARGDEVVRYRSSAGRVLGARSSRVSRRTGSARKKRSMRRRR
jgi:hypothetical protein